MRLFPEKLEIMQYSLNVSRVWFLGFGVIGFLVVEIVECLIIRVLDFSLSLRILSVLCIWVLFGIRNWKGIIIFEPLNQSKDEYM